jgi:hypothetical protein
LASTPLTSLEVDFAELCVALEADVPGDTLRWYLDAQTGAVTLVSREYDPAENQGLTVADMEGDPARFVRVPAGEVSAVDDMRAFARQVSDGRLKESLEMALSAPRPERRFRAVLGWLPEEQERWHDFRQSQVESRARAWLASLGVTRR